MRVIRNPLPLVLGRNGYFEAVGTWPANIAVWTLKDCSPIGMANGATVGTIQPARTVQTPTIRTLHTGGNDANERIHGRTLQPRQSCRHDAAAKSLLRPQAFEARQTGAEGSLRLELVARQLLYCVTLTTNGRYKP